jgi:hypothetical protein
MTKHIESIVPRVPVRDADRAPAALEIERSSGPRPIHGLVPVRELPGLTPDEQFAELRLRVQRGMYGKPGVVEQVARAMHARGL